MTLSGRFVILLVLGVVPVVAAGVAGAGTWTVLGCWLLLCAVLAVVDLCVAASPRRLRIERRLPARVRLGEEAESVLSVANAGSRTLRARVRDAWQPSAGATRPRQPVTVPPGERRVLTQRLVPFRRGDRTVDQVTVRSYGPLGLAARQATLSAPGRLRVLPPFLSRKHLPSRIARLRELDGATSVMVRGQGTEFDSLREYVRGDDVRSIDWRATARRRDLVVRTWRPERDRRVVIVIDTGRTSAARVQDEPRIDTAIEATLLLAALATRAGDRVDVVAYDRRVRARVQGATGAALLSGIVDALADVDPELIETDWEAVPAQVRSATAHRALVVVLTAAGTPGSSTGLLSVLPQLTRSHLVVIGSVTDPELERDIARRSGRQDVFRAAAAERALLDEARVAAAVERLGAEIVTGSPADLPPAVADRYIALKAAGRL